MFSLHVHLLRQCSVLRIAVISATVPAIQAKLFNSTGMMPV